MTPPHAPKEILSLCMRCSEAFNDIEAVEERIAFVRREMGELEKEKSLFAGLVAGILEGEKYPDIGQATMFDNEIPLYADAVHKFSLRAFLWKPGGYTPPHDHGSWGVIGPVTGKLEVINYAREDDGSEPGRAALVEKERFTLDPGETTFTLPLDDGIHSVGNPTDETVFSLSLYGRPLPRGYILGFDIAKGSSYRIISARTKKKRLLVRALSGLDPALAEKAREKMAAHPVEFYRELGEEGSSS
jgi:predicted metal-dependent enzyme (double-stranded beta helix superfamily)